MAWKAQRDGGYFLVFEDDRIQLYANYASEPPWAAEKTARTRRWQRIFGSWKFEISDIAEQVRRYRAQQAPARARGNEPMVRPGMEARARFLETIDPVHLREVTRYRVRTFQLYNAIRRCPGLFDLVCEHGETPDLAGGGALAYALANIPILLDPGPQQPLRTARRLLRRKRKDIAAALGFPAETAALATRVLGRIPTRELCPDTIRSLRAALTCGDTRTRKLLAHARRINRMAVKLVEDPDVVEWLTPALLHEIGLVDSLRDACALYELVRDTLGMLARREARMPEVRSITEMRALHDTEIERAQFDLAERRQNLELPSAPVPELPGQIEYVSASQAALDAEGADMHNCVGGYAPRVARGECFIYRVMEPERCTVEINLGRDGRFRITQIRAVCNGRVHRETVRTVERWLDTHQAPQMVERVRSLGDRSAYDGPALFDDYAENEEAACPF